MSLTLKLIPMKVYMIVNGMVMYVDDYLEMVCR